MPKKPSDLELQFMAYVETHAKDLPPYEFNFKFSEVNKKMEIDFCWPSYRCGVEVDGGQWQKNGGSHARDSHRRKNNLATLEGWSVLHYSGEMMTGDPLRMLDEIREMLGTHGWKNAKKAR